MVLAADHERRDGDPLEGVEAVADWAVWWRSCGSVTQGAWEERRHRCGDARSAGRGTGRIQRLARTRRLARRSAGATDATDWQNAGERQTCLSTGGRSESVRSAVERPAKARASARARQQVTSRHVQASTRKR